MTLKDLKSFVLIQNALSQQALEKLRGEKSRSVSATDSLIQEQRVSCKVISAQKASENADGALKQIHIDVLGER